jgi:hypothetical protein
MCALMTFGTCQVRDARVVFAHMETVIRIDTYRSSQVLIWLGFAILVGLFGLGYFLYHHPQIEIPHFVGRLASVAFGAALIGRYRCCPKTRSAPLCDRKLRNTGSACDARANRVRMSVPWSAPGPHVNPVSAPGCDFACAARLCWSPGRELCAAEYAQRYPLQPRGPQVPRDKCWTKNR